MEQLQAPIWNLPKAAQELNEAYSENSETDLLRVLKDNSFLFYELYKRKYGIQPVFREVSFGGKLRCDFAWLNDNSDGPEWVLVEVEKPKMRIFNGDGSPSSELNKAIEQMKTWQRYFAENPQEKKRIFGAVARFRYILVAGSGEDWSDENALKWRSYENTISNIEIRSTDVFLRSMKLIEADPNEFWSFEEHPVTLEPGTLENYWKSYDYMDLMRRVY